MKYPINVDRIEAKCGAIPELPGPMDHWDTGPGETSSFPTKWISADGRTAHLVCSGNDHFSVREARFITSD